jgi:hypothetical protein
MSPALPPPYLSVHCYTEVFEKNGANACASFNGSVHHKGVQGGIGGTTKTTSFEARLLHDKGENREASSEYDP